MMLFASHLMNVLFKHFQTRFVSSIPWEESTAIQILFYYSTLSDQCPTTIQSDTLWCKLCHRGWARFVGDEPRDLWSFRERLSILGYLGWAPVESRNLQFSELGSQFLFGFYNDFSRMILRSTLFPCRALAHVVAENLGCKTARDFHEAPELNSEKTPCEATRRQSFHCPELEIGPKKLDLVTVH